MLDRKEFEAALPPEAQEDVSAGVDILGAYISQDVRMIRFGWDLARRNTPQAPRNPAPPPVVHPNHYVLTPNGPESVEHIIEHRRQLHKALSNLVGATDPYRDASVEERLQARIAAFDLLKAIKP
jgi:hypothetical protein